MPTEEKMVSVPESQLASILEDVKKLKEDNHMLKETADKSRVASFMAKHKDFTTKKCRVTTYEGRVVTGWKVVKDIVAKRGNAWMEEQIVEITVDGLKDAIPMPLTDFGKLTKVDAEILTDVTQKTLDGESRIFTLKVGDQEIGLNATFVN